MRELKRELGGQRKKKMNDDEVERRGRRSCNAVQLESCV